MITVLVRVERGVEALAVTLASLVPGVAAGLVADAIVLAGEVDDDLARLADAAGATLLVSSAHEGWSPGADPARRAWLWCLSDGDAPAEGWIRPVGQFVSLAALDGRRIGRPAYRPLSPAARIGRLAERVRGGTVRAGDLVRRDLLAAPGSRARPLPLPVRVARDPAFR